MKSKNMNGPIDGFSGAGNKRRTWKDPKSRGFGITTVAIAELSSRRSQVGSWQGYRLTFFIRYTGYQIADSEARTPFIMGLKQQHNSKHALLSHNNKQQSESTPTILSRKHGSRIWTAAPCELFYGISRKR